MISATFSSLVIRGYEDALAAVTVLTAYIPMLTDAGGNAGSQSTSTIIRGMAVGDIQPHDLPRILWRESRVALLCGGTLAVCNFVKLLVFDQVDRSGGAGGVPDLDLHHPALADHRRHSARGGRKAACGSGRDGFTADHHHCGYHHAADLLQHCKDRCCICKRRAERYDPRKLYAAGGHVVSKNRKNVLFAWRIVAQHNL